MGSGYIQISYDPTQALNQNDAAARHELGSLTRYNEKTYMYVQHHQGTDTVASAAGMPAYWRDRDAIVVTGDKTDNLYGATLQEGVAGIYQGVVTHLNFTWLVFGGVALNVPLNGAGVIGNIVIPPPTNTDNQLVTVAIAAATAAQAAAQRVGVQKTVGVGASNLAQVDLRLHVQD